MITLSRVDTVRKSLQRAWDTLFATSTDSEMRSLKIPGAGAYSSNDQPIVLVVSSMAGGAGASMALDICRLLTLVQGLDPKLMGVFMVTPDIFDSLPESARAIASVADGCVVGSAIVKDIGAGKPVSEVLTFVSTLAAGAHSA